MELPDDSDDASLDSLSLPDSPLPSDTVPVPDSLLSDVAPESSSSSSSSSPPDDALKVPDSADDAEASSSSSPLADALADDADADDALADSDSLAELAEADSDSDSESEALDMDDSVSSSLVSDLQEFLFLVFVAARSSHRAKLSTTEASAWSALPTRTRLLPFMCDCLRTTEQPIRGLYSFSIIRFHSPRCSGSVV